MIILQCSTRACGRGYREKPFEMIAAPDRWMTRLPLPLWTYAYSVSICMFMRLCRCIRLLVLFMSLRGYYINMYACLRLHAPTVPGCVNMCAIWLAGTNISPLEFLAPSHSKAGRIYIRETDCSTTAMTATNGRNKTLFNEDANLRTITLCSEIRIRNRNANHAEKSVEERHGPTQGCPTLFSCV